MALISSKRVPNSGPINSPILIIGEAPGQDEEREGKPFVGKSGEKLESVLAGLRISRDEVRLANLCQFRPHDNKFEYLEESSELRSGIQELKSYIKEQRSSLRVIILLGERPLQYIGGQYGISKWRGSIINVDGVNTIPTYHPAYVLRDASVHPIFTFDIARACKIANEGYIRPTDKFTMDPRGLDLEEVVQEILLSEYVSCDIETKTDTTYIRCIGFGLSNSRAICLANHDYQGMDLTLFNTLTRIFSAKDKKFIFHNGLFDTTALKLNGISNVEMHEDTMIMQHVLEPEMPKKLSFLMSLYTNRPYHKGMVKDEDDEKGWGDKVPKEILHEYNCIDCVATYECYSKMLLELKEGKQYNYYRYKMELCEVAQHISMAGMLVDEERVELLKNTLSTKWKQDQELLNNIIGFSLNVKSPKQMKEILYDTFKLPVKKTFKGTITTDEDALVSLMTYCKDQLNSKVTDEGKYEWKKKLGVLVLSLKIREYRQLLSNYFNAKRREGRLHSMYDPAGTETERWAARAYIDGTGINSQTFPRASLEV